jgi:hypothetical protein
MHYFKKILLTSFIFFSVTVINNAQDHAVPFKKDFVFSAIKGTVSKPGSITLPTTLSKVKLISGDTASFKILSYQKTKLILAFTPSANFVGITKAKLQLKSANGKSILLINLTGLSTNGLEGENEAPLSRIVEALGYQAGIGWTSLANHSRPELQGEELSSSLFKKAGKGKVEIIPVARYSPDFELPFGYYIDTAAMPDKHQVGILAKAGVYPEHQTLFPAIANGANSFDPGNHPFGFYATGPTHSAYSEDVWNMLLFPSNAVHATRIYPLKNIAGRLLPDTYLLCFEEAKNGDYNDYVFVVKNIKPVINDLFTPLFNGKNLEGWHTYLDKIGKNADPDTNFIIENNMLHVVGKDLGYAIT